MAKGFLLVLRDAFKSAGGAEPAALKPASAPSSQPEALSPTSLDYKAVRNILDVNGLKDRKVEGCTVVEKGRVVKLYLQEGGVTELPASIGTLTELRVLHVYGDRSLGHKMLEKISPGIGHCTKLEELLLDQNDLTTLPAEITSLTNLKKLSLADNKLKDLPPAVAEWAKRFDPEGLAKQKP
jgi:Leucine-rich repeat (LRR) protein